MNELKMYDCMKWKCMIVWNCKGMYEKKWKLHDWRNVSINWEFGHNHESSDTYQNLNSTACNVKIINITV